MRYTVSLFVNVYWWIDNRNAIDAGHPAGYCFELAVDLLNGNTINEPPAEFQGLVSGYSIVPRVRDSNTDQQTAIFAAVDLVKDGVIGIIGDYNSVISEQVSYVCAHYGVPQVRF